MPLVNPITVRIPELPAKTTDLALSLFDRLPIWIQSQNKTKRIDLQDLYSFFLSGGGGGTAHPPVYWGGVITYQVPEGIGSGVTSVSLPDLAGMDFYLRRGGLPMEVLKEDLSNAATARYDILDAGGFELLQTGDELQPLEWFELTVFSLIGSSSPPGPSTTSAFITGKKLIDANVTLNVASDMNKILQIRSLTTQILITIPTIADIPVNSVMIFESTINNSVENRITTTGGQNIYFNNTSKTSIYIRPGETLWLFRDSDGLYVINDFGERYKQLAKPYATYRSELNQLVCKGQEVNRSDYPRLWEYVQTLGASLVTEAVWQTASVIVAGRTVEFPYRGCFSDGDGSSTFRLPDLMNMTLRGVKTETGSDTERHLNKPGGYQKNEVLAHSHKVDTTGNQGTVDPDRSIQRSATNGDGYGDGTGARKHIEDYGGAETRMDNVGILWVINV